ncbi:hypothetical protein [Methylobacter sp. S3L5C]|uniref:hypothetical protein n=1 Tax=Methylobacter sp. S3L5C TaxID=2839024 RepID=UPI001FAE57E0|nr:hypothetical protein [Methylobacter sp. S3L5C]UOA07506.1 hypothetical protein KKZ03_14690 [Methylobacter sp. S3L5C]UOA07516.1 hypothetical protein KKZ03_14740 [Methylobacter sp. S3L5C]
MSDFEETRLFENLDLIKKELQQEMQSQAVCELDEVQHNGLVLDVKKVVSDWLASPKKYYFFRFRSAFHFSVKIHQNGFGFCYTQTRDGRPSKIVINRAEFLRK